MESPRGITIATVCARGGSKGLPGKNIRPFPGADGAPLIAHTIGHALASTRIDQVYVSTDDDAIAQAARNAGATVPYLRPAELATDSVGKLPAVEHLVAHLEAQGLRIATVVDLQPTSPLRNRGDIERCLDAMDGVDLAVSVYDSGFHPAFNLVELAPDGLARLYAQAGGVSRQALPPVYAMNGSIYCWRRAALARAAVHGLWSVPVRGVTMPRERSADIDDLLDFEWAAWLYRRQAAQEALA
ncbi:acylneuraminate cytidylyltransferase family protein [uncultured Ramlibacter sp.]|uniref:acylneuraminate cytidylyltransferase family protein n=1 Tax=uncultured Ramlibacter sp. TaxID=260755 RepID=UPI00260D9250|nr:acylneuraminate cytidylyltransferase family protein [uncultured Ramlibacter sp.]